MLYVVCLFNIFTYKHKTYVSFIPYLLFIPSNICVFYTIFTINTSVGGQDLSNIPYDREAAPAEQVRHTPHSPYYHYLSTTYYLPTTYPSTTFPSTSYLLPIYLLPTTCYPLYTQAIRHTTYAMHSTSLLHPPSFTLLRTPILLYSTTVLHPPQVRQSLQSSLKNLQTDYIDSLLLHSPLPR
jgi:hypothetical protein